MIPRPRSRADRRCSSELDVDRHELVQLGLSHRREAHDLGQVLGEVAERASRDARDLGVLR